MKSENYEEFVDKFKPKLTTDDCYTPTEIYDAIADWVAKEYKLDRANFVRPFYPGGHLEHFEYSPDCVVCDNPPFSILSKIVNFYIDNNIKFFIFAPALTLFNTASTRCAAIVTSCNVEYSNRAIVKTSFLTNLEPDDVQIRTIPELYDIVADAGKLISKAKQLPAYEYPPCVISAAGLSPYSRDGVAITIKRGDCVRISALDSQRKVKKGIFGGGYILSDNATDMMVKADIERREKALLREARRQAERDVSRTFWSISERERGIIEELNNKENEGG